MPSHARAPDPTIHKNGQPGSGLVSETQKGGVVLEEGAPLRHGTATDLTGAAELHHLGPHGAALPEAGAVGVVRAFLDLRHLSGPGTDAALTGDAESTIWGLTEMHCRKPAQLVEYVLPSTSSTFPGMI